MVVVSPTFILTSRSTSPDLTSVTPRMKTATPRWAIIMPTIARGICRARRTIPTRAADGERSRSTRSVETDATIQNAISRPSAPTTPMLPWAQTAPTVATSVVPAAHRRRFARSGSSASFHRASGPIPIRKINGVSSGTKTVSK